MWNILSSTGGGNLCNPIHSEKFGRSVWIMYLWPIQNLSLVIGCPAYMYLMAILIGVLYVLYCDRNSMYVMRSGSRSARVDISLTTSVDV